MHWGVPLPCILANAYALGNVVRATNHKNRRCAHLSIALVQRSSAPGPRPAYASLPNFIGPSASRAGRRWCQDDNDLPAGKNPCRPPPVVRDCRRRCPQPAARWQPPAGSRSPTQPQPAAAPINRSLRSVGFVRPPPASPPAARRRPAPARPRPCRSLAAAARPPPGSRPPQKCERIVNLAHTCAR